LGLLTFATVSPEDPCSAPQLKLSPRFFGPFQILSRVELVAYKLALPPEARLLPVFHVSCLKKKLEQFVSPLSSLPLVDPHGEIRPEPELIVDCRLIKRNGCTATEVLFVGRARHQKMTLWSSYGSCRTNSRTLWARFFEGVPLLRTFHG